MQGTLPVEYDDVHRPFGICTVSRASWQPPTARQIRWNSRCSRSFPRRRMIGCAGKASPSHPRSTAPSTDPTCRAPMWPSSSRPGRQRGRDRHGDGQRPASRFPALLAAVRPGERSGAVGADRGRARQRGGQGRAGELGHERPRGLYTLRLTAVGDGGEHQAAVQVLVDNVPSHGTRPGIRSRQVLLPGQG